VKLISYAEQFNELDRARYGLVTDEILIIGKKP
jgi:hypothetical protein